MKARLVMIARGETGKILIMALVLLVLGALLLTPLLGLMNTGLTAGQVYERKAAQLYAADAGVEDAIWKILNAEKAGLPDVPCGDEPWDEPYKYPNDGDPTFVVNRNDVQVSLMYLSGGTYRITSAAFDDLSSTTVEAYVSASWRTTGEWEWDVVVPEGDSYPGGKIEEGAKVYAEGDLTVDGIIEDGSFVYVEGNLTVEKIEDGCTVYVGGSLTVTESMAEDNVKVCVGGDAWIPKIETGDSKESVEVYVIGDLTVYLREGLQGSGNIEDDNTVVCVGRQLVYQGEIDGSPDIYASGGDFKPFDQCPILCWECLEPEFELVVEILTYEVGAVV